VHYYEIELLIRNAVFDKLIFIEKGCSLCSVNYIYIYIGFIYWR
jgi:hypothetical protein